METILIILMVFALVLLAIVVELLVLDMTHNGEELDENKGLPLVRNLIVLFHKCHHSEVKRNGNV